MLGTDSVLEHIRRLGHARDETREPQMSLFDNTAAAVPAVFARRSLDGPWLQVALRDPPEAVDPPPATALEPPWTAVLKQGERPLALLVGEFLAGSRTAPRCIRMPLIREARARLLDCELVEEIQLQRLAAG